MRPQGQGRPAGWIRSILPASATAQSSSVSMISASLCGALMAITLNATGAFALTVTNQETEPQSIIVFSGDTEEAVVVEPNMTVDLRDFCTRTCIIELPNGDGYEVFAGEAAVLESGELFIESSTEQGSAAPQEQNPAQQ